MASSGVICGGDAGMVCSALGHGLQIEFPIAVRIAPGVEPESAAENGGGLETIGVAGNRLEAAGAAAVDQEDRLLSAGIGQPKFPHPGGKIGRRQSPGVLSHRGVADDLDDQIRRPLDFHVAPRLVARLGNQPGLAGRQRPREIKTMSGSADKSPSGDEMRVLPINRYPRRPSFTWRCNTAAISLFSVP